MNLKPNEHICLTSVTKVFHLGFFKKKIAVKDLTLSVPKGKVIGLLGPNGSGKSTTIKMIMGFLRPTEGEILVCGYSAENRAARNFIGYLPENPRFQKFLTAHDLLRYYGGLLGISGKELQNRAEYLLDLVGLKLAAHERVQGFSKGMTQRLAIAQALLNQPKLLIFDEPMSGLDPLGRMEIRKLIAQVHAEMPESTIFFSSHVLEDVEQLCSMVALLRRGELKTYSEISDLVLKEEQRFNITVRGLNSNELQQLREKKELTQTPIGMYYSVSGTDELISELERIKSLGAFVVGVSSHKRRLEEALFRDGEFLNDTKAAAPEVQL